MLVKYLQVIQPLPTHLKKLVCSYTLSTIPVHNRSSFFCEHKMVLDFMKPTEIEIELYSGHFKIFSIYTGMIEVNYKDLNNYISFLTSNVGGIARTSVIDGATGGVWMRSVKVANSIRLIGFGESNRGVACFSNATLNKITSIINVKYEQIGFLIRNLYMFNNLRYLSVYMMQSDRTSKLHVNFISTEKALEISKHTQKLVLLYNGDAETVFEKDCFAELVNSINNIHIKFAGINFNEVVRFTDKICDTIKDLQIDTICLDNFEPNDSFSRHLGKFTKLHSLKIKSHGRSPLVHVSFRSECLRELVITTIYVQSCDFGGLQNLEKIFVTGLIDMRSFNTLPGTVQVISSKGSAKFLGRREVKTIRYHLPTELVSFKSSEFPPCYQLDPTKCQKLNSLKIESKTLGTIRDYGFWKRIPKSVKLISIRFSGDQYWLYFMLNLNEKLRDLELTITSESKVCVFLSSDTLSSLKYDFHSASIPVKIMNEKYKRAYCVIHNISSRIMFCFSKSVTLLCPERDAGQLSIKFENGKLDYKEVERIKGYIVYESCSK